MKVTRTTSRLVLPALLLALGCVGSATFALADPEGGHGKHGGMQGMQGMQEMPGMPGMKGMKGMQGMKGGGCDKEGGSAGGHGKHGGGADDHGKHGGGGHGKQGGGGHGKQGGEHDGPELYGPDWKTTLTDAQKAQFDQLHADLARAKEPAKARIKAAEVELAVLAVADQPDQAAIDVKINELLESQRAMLRAKYRYIAAQRQIMTPEQQVSFDMHTIHSAMHDKKKGKGGGGHH